jgi:D-tagatose-1,6-bisphosphate aldolase subunit GatZ/KbaZ
MARARALVTAYVEAGFTKIHLDCSEGCAGEPMMVGDAISAARAADLAAVCEAAAGDGNRPSYVFGTEVPPPGGARAEDGALGIAATTPESAHRTIEAHRAAFRALGLEANAWRRAVGLVVQPGLEFAPDHVHRFDLGAPDRLSAVLDGHDGLSFEAHSTDYQAPEVFPALARRHFGVLKVGPALTFAYRQAIYGLDAVAEWLGTDREPIIPVMEALMLENSKHWMKHYSGDPATLKLLRHFSYADRIRYCWAQPRAIAAVERLLSGLAASKPPAPLIEQHFAPAVIDGAATLLGRAGWTKALIYSQIQVVLLPYFACVGELQ